MARILLIDDDADLREMLAIRLNRAGHLVTELQGGGAVLRKVLPMTFDLVITDIYMAEGEGIETLRHLRRNHPDLPVIVISGAGANPGDGGFLSMAKALGAFGALAKPFGSDALFGLIDEALQAHAA